MLILLRMRGKKEEKWILVHFLMERQERFKIKELKLEMKQLEHYRKVLYLHITCYFLVFDTWDIAQLESDGCADGLMEGDGGPQPLRPPVVHEGLNLFWWLWCCEASHALTLPGKAHSAETLRPRRQLNRDLMKVKVTCVLTLYWLSDTIKVFFFFGVKVRRISCRSIIAC